MQSTHLAPPSCCHLAALLLQLYLKQLCSQQRHRPLTVSSLRPLLLQQQQSVGAWGVGPSVALRFPPSWAPPMRLTALPRSTGPPPPQNKPTATLTWQKMPVGLSSNPTPHYSTPPSAAAQNPYPHHTYLAEDADAGRLVHQVHCGLHLVHVLPASTARSRRRQLDFLESGGKGPEAWRVRASHRGMASEGRQGRAPPAAPMHAGRWLPPHPTHLGSIFTPTLCTTAMMQCRCRADAPSHPPPRPLPHATPKTHTLVNLHIDIVHLWHDG